MYLRLQALLLLALGTVILLRRPEDWETIYVPAARHLLAGVSLYVDPGRFTYPPAAVLLPLVVLGLPHFLQLAAWIAVNLAALAVLLHCGWRAAGGTEPRLPAREHGRIAWHDAAEHAATWLGLAIALRFALLTFEHRQVQGDWKSFHAQPAVGPYVIQPVTR